MHEVASDDVLARLVQAYDEITGLKTEAARLSERADFYARALDDAHRRVEALTADVTSLQSQLREQHLQAVQSKIETANLAQNVQRLELQHEADSQRIKQAEETIEGLRNCLDESLDAYDEACNNAIKLENKMAHEIGLVWQGRQEERLRLEEAIRDRDALLERAQGLLSAEGRRQLLLAGLAETLAQRERELRDSPKSSG